ncbi:ABC transporter substrate-binding protein [Pendulispora brunnea]|uniref:ABC transporter substrate-binding protein n=1 Tax=Pendulispora brunnea TaxID=2905690 RepID=A0ABZ2KKV8_9BACT
MIRTPLLVGTLAMVLGGFVASNTACTATLGKDVDQCNVNQDCTRFAGTNFCRKSDKTCQPLTSSDCPYIYGNHQDDNAVYIGAVISLTGDYGDNGQYKPYEAAVRTAIDDFEKETKGLPPVAGSGGRTRPVVAIVCDDKSASENDNATVLRSARHLVERVKVAAIIGTPSTSTTVAMATDVTIPNGVFTISPSATSDNITLLRDYGPGETSAQGLLWRTAPSDTYQAQAIATYVQQKLIPGVRAKYNLPAQSKVRILTLLRGDAYGEGLNATFRNTPAFTTGIRTEDYRDYNYGTSENAPTQSEIQQQIRDFAPHIILTFGLAESRTQIIPQTEQLWGNLQNTKNQPRPYYVATEGLVTDLEGLMRDYPTVASRTLYTSPSLGSVENSVFSNFRDNYFAFVDNNYPAEKDSIKGRVNEFGLAGTYDSTYIIAYAVTSASSGNRPPNVTGRDIVAAMKNLVSGDVADLYRRRIGVALTTLGRGQSVDINGASGPLNFDLNTGDVAADIPFACLKSHPNTSQGEGFSQDSLLVYRSEPQSIQQGTGTPNCDYSL